MAERKVQVPDQTSPELDERIDDLLDAAGVTADRDLLFEIFVTAVRLARDDADPLDLKITNAALKEMRNAFRAFAPYRGAPQGDHLRLGPHPRRRPALRPGPRRRRARWPTRAGWSSPAPAPASWPPAWRGPGAAQSFGVSIRLPFEQARQPDHRLRRQARLDEVLLHPQAHAGEGVEGLHLPAGRLRHARRDVRAADPHPDRQGRCRCRSCSSTSPAAPTGRRRRSSSRPSWSAGRW